MPDTSNTYSEMPPNHQAFSVAHENGITSQTVTGSTPNNSSEGDVFDYSYIPNPARIAVYDNLKAAPRIIQIEGGPTAEYIENIASLTFKYAKEAGGAIPYTVIREVSENFIHARFCEVVVSILDSGNTIRFADQGPGIQQKEQALEPGFSSAIEPMKHYIRGVGSGLPIVNEYLTTSQGYIQIEDNLNKGSVVTISLIPAREPNKPPMYKKEAVSVTENEAALLKVLLENEVLGVTEANHLTNISVSSIHTAFTKLENAGYVEKLNKKRTLTSKGRQLALSL